jgi:hypothetical protein
MAIMKQYLTVYYFCVDFAGFYGFLGSLIVGHLQIQAKCGCVNGSIFFVHMYTNMWLTYSQHFSRQMAYKFLKWTILRHYLQNGIVNVNYANNFLMVSGSGKLWLISSVYPKVGLQCIMGLWCTQLCDNSSSKISHLQLKLVYMFYRL